MQLVWFKKDLRISDHRPLIEAVQRGPVCCLYIYEPSLLHSPEWDRSHSVFIDDCLEELENDLHLCGLSLVYRYGEVCEVFAELHRDHGISHVWSHEETGNALTYQRDVAFGQWCHAHGIQWQEYSQNGVVRRLGNRDGWNKRWSQRMQGDILKPPETCHNAQVPCGQRLRLEDFELLPSTVDDHQRGGTRRGIEMLNKFSLCTRSGLPYGNEFPSDSFRIM